MQGIMEGARVAFPADCVLGRLLRREKRFRVLVEVEGEGPLWAHCNNSGSLLGVWGGGRKALLSPTANPNRKLPYTLELVQVGRTWVGVNTLTPNRLLYQGWRSGVIKELAGFNRFRKEVSRGESRLDALLEGGNGRLWVEAKNVTLLRDGRACFPDAVTTRGLRHLHELIRAVEEGDRAACFYLVQREDAEAFAPADFIDPEYARALRRAADGGVEVWAYKARVSPGGISLWRPISVEL